jgi:hypothetical protein
MGTDTDEDLAAGLKAAKTRRMYFALVMKGGADGALLLAKTKVPPADIAAAKKKTGGSALLTGFCFYEDGKYVFEVGRVPPATAANIIKLIAKRDGGQTIAPIVRLSQDPELQESNQQDGQATAAQAPKTAAEKKPFGDAELQLSLKSWTMATTKIRGDLKTLTTRIATEVDEEEDLGPAIEAYVNDKLASMETELNAALTKVGGGADEAAKSAARDEAVATIDRLQAEVAADKAITSLWEKNPFGAINVSPVLKATFNSIKRTVAG